jgi:hypothetical protein
MTTPRQQAMLKAIATNEHNNVGGGIPRNLGEAGSV